MKVVLIILLILFLSITFLLGVTIINISRDPGDLEDYNPETAESSGSKITTPDSKGITIDDFRRISRMDMENTGTDEKENETVEDDGAASVPPDEEVQESSQDQEEEPDETTAQDEIEETAEEDTGGAEAEEIEDNTIKIFLDGDMENGIYLGQTICDKESAEAAELYGEEFKNTGFKFTYKNDDISFLPGSTHYLYIYFYCAESGWDYIRKEINLPGEKVCEKNIIIFIDEPEEKIIIDSLQLIKGWAVDLRNDNGPGIGGVELYLDGPKDYGKFIGNLQYNFPRPGVVEFFENQNYLNSGYHFYRTVDLEPGSIHTLFIYAFSSEDNAFNYEKREIYLSGIKEEKAVIKAQININELSLNNKIELTGWAAGKKALEDYLEQKQETQDETRESNDGRSIKKLVFVSNRDGGKNIYSINIDGTELTRLTYHSGGGFYPEVSPDGEKIAYTSDIGGVWQVMTMDWDGGNEKQITHNNFRSAYPSWSFDGKYIYFETYADGDWELFRIKSDGTGQKRLTFDSNSYDWHPSAHPYQYKIIYESGVTGHENIYIMNHDGSGKRKMVSDGPRRRVPDVSYDESKITYMRYSGSNSDIWIMDYSGQNETRLTSNPDWDGHPSFSPDGTFIVYEEKKGSREDLILIDLASGGKINITNSSSVDEDASFLYR